METVPLEVTLRQLVCGLADQDILANKPYFYGGGRLLAEDVAALGLPSILCLADRLAVSLGMPSLGYHFALGDVAGGFPLRTVRDPSRPELLFSAAAPLLYEVFVHDVRACRQDLARLFERAARVIDPAFSLAANARPLVTASRVAAEGSTLDMG